MPTTTAEPCSSCSCLQWILRIRGRAATSAIASIALSIKLSSTCCSSTRTASTGGSAPAIDCSMATRWVAASASTNRRASAMTSTTFTSVFVPAVFWKKPRMFAMTSPTRPASRMIRRTAAAASSRFGCFRESHRRQALLLVSIATTNWLRSWPIDAVSAPTFSTRVTCASSCCERCSASPA